MKRIQLFILLLILALHAKAATYVSIPDSSFRAALIELYPTCFNTSGQLDKDCSAVLNTTSLNVRGKSIKSLDGIQYFAKMNVVDCGKNKLDKIPNLPSGVTVLICDRNLISLFAPLPAVITDIDCSHNSIENLPVLPASLKKINCSWNRLPSLPIMPLALTHLNCSVNELVDLPPLPNGLIELICNFSGILKKLPTLPAGLQILDCSVNYIERLPDLPLSLIYLDCMFNNLLALPILPSGLDTLICSVNAIKALPPLPVNLKLLECLFNKLTYLPDLPFGLTYLDAGRNCFSTLPINPNPLVLKYFVVTPNTSNCTITASDNPSETLSFNLYPNPVENRFYINTTAVLGKLALHNSCGQLVYSEQIPANKEIIMEGMPSGIYTLTLILDGVPKTSKIVKN